MKRAQTIGICLILVLLLLSACGPTGTPSAQAPAAPTKAAWQTEWEKVLAAARQEGKVQVMHSGAAEEARAMTQGMKDTYGIDAEVIVTRGVIEAPKMYAERKAGLYLRDIWGGGYSTTLQQWKPDGLMETLDAALIQPHLTDPEVIKKVWWQGKLWWVDKEHYVLITTLQPSPTIVVNTSLVKEGEVKSYRDLLDPKWKDKMIQGDPTIPGAAQSILAAILGIMGEDYVKELAKMGQIISRDDRQVLDWLATGKKAIAIAPNGEMIPVYEKAGAPVKIIWPTEGTRLAALASGFAWHNNPAHPNAAKVFINWITSREGQEYFAPVGANHSLRLDVVNDYLRPEQMRQPGVKYYDTSTEEAVTVKMAAAANLAKELFAPKK